LNELLEALKKYDLLKNEQISGSGTASTNTQAVVY